jgi:hypothetical protein
VNLRRVATAIALSGAAVASFSMPAHAATAANSWTYNSDGSITKQAQAVKPARQGLGLCHGTFQGPKKSGSSVHMTVYISCTSPAAVIASAALDKCTRTGGRDDFSCTTVKRNHGSTPGKAYYLNVPIDYTCRTGFYRPRAYYQSVNGIEYPDVTGNVVTVTC